MNRPDAARLLAMVTAIWPAAKTDDPKAHVYAWSSVLEDVTFDAAAAAVKALGRSQKFPPTPSELIEAIHAAARRAALTAPKCERCSSGWIYVDGVAGALRCPACSEGVEVEPDGVAEPDDGPKSAAEVREALANFRLRSA